MARVVPKGKRVTVDFVPEGYQYYDVKDGDTWITVATAHGIEPLDLILANFKTTVPREVNWYLREYVGCRTATRDNKNWTFRNPRRGKGDGNDRWGKICVPIQEVVGEPVVIEVNLVPRVVKRVWYKNVQSPPAGDRMGTGVWLGSLFGGREELSAKRKKTVSERWVVHSVHEKETVEWSGRDYEKTLERFWNWGPPPKPIVTLTAERIVHYRTGNVERQSYPSKAAHRDVAVDWWLDPEEECPGI